jgi:hypothetical protein
MDGKPAGTVRERIGSKARLMGSIKGSRIIFTFDI